ncbi:MAG: phage terminase large subunit, partial [Epibacterium sp.]|nr:phage terminase large subunit [Epibacterium sp.]
PVFEPLLAPSRYKGAWGGRGSGKSQFFADAIIIEALKRPGLRVLACREIQKSLKESAKRLLESKIEGYRLGGMFEVQSAEIKTPGGGSIVFAGLQDHTSESIKSYEGFDIAWIEEAQTVSERSLNLLRPTIRAPGSELWFSWNPRFDTDAVDKMLRGVEMPSDVIVVKANHSDNPWLPQELEREREDCLRAQPDQYDHIWEGGYATVTEGAYYAQVLATARNEGRIGSVTEDSLMGKRAYWDIGVSDATAIWVTQQVGDKLRFIDHYEAENQPLAAHLEWLRSNGHGNAECVLPHDGAQRDKVTAIRFEDHISRAGFNVRTVENQGMGAAFKRIEAARARFNRFWFDEEKCAKGLKALGWYHEKKNQGGYGVGVDHDWASHSADAFGLAAVDYREPRASVALDYSKIGVSV